MVSTRPQAEGYLPSPSLVSAWTQTNSNRRGAHRERRRRRADRVRVGRAGQTVARRRGVTRCLARKGGSKPAFRLAAYRDAADASKTAGDKEGSLHAPQLTAFAGGRALANRRAFRDRLASLARSDGSAPSTRRPRSWPNSRR